MKRFLFFTAMAFIITVFALTGCKQKTEEEPVVEKKPAVVEEEPPAVKEKAVEIPEPVKAEEEAVKVVKKAKEETAEERPPEQFTTKRILYVREKGIPEDYKDLSNPLDATKENIKKGRELFSTQCSMCHGEKGLGDSLMGKGLNWPASNIAAVIDMPEVTDAYLFWAISEGGAALQTAMFSYKSTLSEEDRWRLILYIRTLNAE
jgi:mono/diheme cytochrome c family protein